MNEAETRAEHMDPALDWFDSTKEGLSPFDVLTGLLNFGLFTAKLPPCFAGCRRQDSCPK